MKKILMFMITIFTFILFVPNVLAVDEINIDIDGETITVYDKDGNVITNSSVYSGAFSFGSNVLTLNEGYYFNAIRVENDGATITSNNKKINVNMMYGINLTISNLKGESFLSDGTKVWDTEQISETESEKLLTHIHSEGNLSIIDSTIKAKVDNPNLVQNAIHNTDSGNIIIKNSTIDIDGFIYSSVASGSLTVEDSNIKTYYISGSNYTQNPGDLIIKNSVIEIIETENYPANYESAVTVTGKNLTITNSRLNTIGIIYVTNNATIKKSNITTSKNNLITQNDLSIDDSIITIDGTISVINNATFTDSTINVLDNNLYAQARVQKTLEMSNTTLNVKGGVIVTTLNMNKSFLHSESATNAKTVEKYGYDISTLSALDVDTINLIDSDFELISNTSVPALAVINSITSNKENFVLIDKDKNILELKNVGLVEYGFYANPNNYTQQVNQSFIEEYYPGTTNVYTGVYNNKAAMYVATSELIEYTIKIKNGTWKDGTTGNKTITLLKGDVPTEDTFKSIGLDGYDVLKIEKTGDKEFTYIYSKLVNPKTGVRNLIILFFISIIGLFLIIKKDKETSFFKNI